MRRPAVLSGLIVFGLFSLWPPAGKARCEETGNYRSTLSDIQQYIKDKNYLKARELSDYLLRNFPDSGEMLYLRAALNQKIGRREQAADDYNVLIERDLADAKVFNNLAALYALKEDFSGAIDLLNRAIKEDPNSVEAHNNLADVFMRIRDYSRAFEEYSKVVALEPVNTAALYNLGFLYARNKDFARAKKNWEKVLSINPQDPDALKAIQSFSKTN